MAQNQTTMYKKFLVGAASAALVASAVAPAVSAKDFKDTKGTHTKQQSMHYRMLVLFLVIRMEHSNRTKR